MARLSDEELFRRGAETLLATWDEYARGASGAGVNRLPGVAAAVFPEEPERTVYNNALVERGLGPQESSAALDVLEGVYAGAGIDRFAVWVHEAERATLEAVERRGYELDAATRAMSAELGQVRLTSTGVELAEPEWSEHLRLIEVPAGFLAGVDPAAFHVAIARLDGESASTAMAFDHDGDCGIYNVGTGEFARRRGLAAGLNACLLRDAVARGSRTASVQASEMAEGMYAAAGFRDLGRLLEYVPPAP